jgi:hypothetical protein
VDINTNEIALAGSAQGESRTSIIAQDIKTNGQIRFRADRAASGGHGSDRFRPDVSTRERNIAKVFDEQTMSATALIGARVKHGRFYDGFEITSPSRRAWQWPQMDNTD